MKNELVIVIIGVFVFLGCNNSGENKNSSVNTSVEQTNNSSQDYVNYLSKGKEIATQAQAVLAGNLVGAIQKGGSTYAVEFCKTKAISLTDSLSRQLNARIRRVTDKPRNVNNQANERELAFMQLMKSKLEKSDSLESKLSEINGKMVGYYPIVMMDMCLQCHGKKELNINSETFEKIHKLYPADKATGYLSNELRGLWVVEMEKK